MYKNIVQKDMNKFNDLFNLYQVQVARVGYTLFFILIPE